MSQQAQPESTPPSKKSRQPLVLVLAAVVVLGGAGAYYWKFQAAPAAAEEEPPPAPPVYVVLDPFVVNLADAGGRRFLRLTLGIVVAGEERAAEFSEDAVTRMRLRSAILEMLAQQTADALITPEGKDALKTSIAGLIAHHAHELEVSDVLFSEFIVQ